jgi:hypothetical protein
MKLNQGTGIANYEVCVWNYSSTIIPLTKRKGRAEEQVPRNLQNGLLYFLILNI